MNNRLGLAQEQADFNLLSYQRERSNWQFEVEGLLLLFDSLPNGRWLVRKALVCYNAH